MAAGHNNQCLEKHWACLVLEKAIYIYMLVSMQCLEKHWAYWKTMHLLVFGKGLAVLQQVVLEKTTSRWLWKRLPAGSKPLYSYF